MAILNIKFKKASRLTSLALLNILQLWLTLSIKARTKQRSLVVTLLDLKNAFGEVHHNLIPTILSYHHIPDNIQLLISSLYTDFNTSIITSHNNTPAIPVGRGVLQGDCLSPLLFNLCFNTFTQYIKAEKYKQLGFSPHDQNDRMFQPVHWFQFADDAAVITSNEKENQLLLNFFTRWCQWAYMIIRVDKCITFGIKKFSSRSLQYQPKLFINNKPIPSVSNGNSFKYLGRHFDFEMTNQEHNSDLLSSLSNMLKQIDSQPLHAKNKLRLYHNFVLSKISWNLTVADLSKTWVVENLDNLVSKYIRQWLDLPISATLSSIILSKNQFGLSLTLPSTKFLQCQTVLRNALKSSPNDNIRSLRKNTSSGTNKQYDRNTKEALKAVQHEHKDRLQNILTSQGSFLSHLFNQNLPQINKLWSKVQSSMPQYIFNFTIWYLNNTLATQKNLKKWNLSQTSDCSFCFLPETLLHVVAGCKTYLEQGRYTWRHNSILNFLATSLKAVNESTIYADIPGFLSPSIITGEKLRPDLLLRTNNNYLYILELTVGFESNLETNATRKHSKYAPLLSGLQRQFKCVSFINLSMSSLGIFGNSYNSFFKMCDSLSIDQQQKQYLISKLSNIAIRTTYYIFCCKHKPWTNPELHPF